MKQWTFTLVTSILCMAGVGQARAGIIFYDNFDGGQAVASGVTATYSGYANIQGVQGYAGIGTGSNVFSGNFLQNDSGGTAENPQSIPPITTTLTLTGLPTHTSINVGFLMAAINSWDGLAGTHGFAGGNNFNVGINGTLIFAASFDNFFAFNQDYVPPPGVQLTSRPFTDLGFPDPTGRAFFTDSAYNLGLDPSFNNIPNTSSTLTIDFYSAGPGWQGGTDESWAIENLSISLDDTSPTPEPGTMTLLCLGIAGMAGYRWRRGQSGLQRLP